MADHSLSTRRDGSARPVSGSVGSWVLLVAAIVVVGVLSVFSDNVPLGGLRVGSASWLLYAAAGIGNDFAVWLCLAVFFGWAHRRTLRSSVLVSLVFSVGAIAAYLVLTPVLYPGTSVASGAGGYVMWLVLALFGGVCGGAIGYFAPRWPIMLAPVAGLAIFRMMNASTWHSSLGLARNVVLVAIVAAVVGYWLLRLVRAGHGRPATS